MATPVKPNVSVMKGGSGNRAPRIGSSPLRAGTLTRLGLAAIVSAGLWLVIVWAIVT